MIDKRCTMKISGCSIGEHINECKTWPQSPLTEAECTDIVKDILCEACGYIAKGPDKDWSLQFPVESSSSTGYIDIAILGKQHKRPRVCLIIEVKRYQKDLSRRKIRSQMAGYCYSTKCSFALCTNVGAWRLYRFEPEQYDPEEKPNPSCMHLIAGVDIEEDGKEKVEEFFRLLRKTSASNERLQATLEAAYQQSFVGRGESMLEVLFSENTVNYLIRQIKKSSYVKLKPARVRENLKELLDSSNAEVAIPIINKHHKLEVKNMRREKKRNKIQNILSPQNTSRLVVQFPGEKPIEHTSAADTFVEVIKKIGIKKIAKLKDNKQIKKPLIMTGPNVNAKGYRQCGGYWIRTHADGTKRKKKILEGISASMGINIQVSIHEEVEEQGKSMLHLSKTISSSTKSSYTDCAQRVLEVYSPNAPMHYKNITDKALEERWLKTQGKTPERTMYARILTEIKAGKEQGQSQRFVKHGHGYVSLSASENRTSEDS